jgi:hypothetical protein
MFGEVPHMPKHIPVRRESLQPNRTPQGAPLHVTVSKKEIHELLKKQFIFFFSTGLS